MMRLDWSGQIFGRKKIVKLLTARSGDYLECLGAMSSGLS